MRLPGVIQVIAIERKLLQKGLIECIEFGLRGRDTYSGAKASNKHVVVAVVARILRAQLQRDPKLASSVVLGSRKVSAITPTTV